MMSSPSCKESISTTTTDCILQNTEERIYLIIKNDMEKYLHKIKEMSTAQEQYQRKFQNLEVAYAAKEFQIKQLQSDIEAQNDIKEFTNIEKNCFKLVKHLIDTNCINPANEETFQYLLSLWKDGLKCYLQQEHDSIDLIIYTIQKIITTQSVPLQDFIKSIDGKEILKQLSLVAALAPSDTTLNEILNISNTLCSVTSALATVYDAHFLPLYREVLVNRQLTPDLYAASVKSMNQLIRHQNASSLSDNGTDTESIEDV